MAFYINPAFQRHPVEAGLIGHMLASFGEIEVTLCFNTGWAHKLVDPVVNTLYAIRTTSTRIETAFRLMQPAAALLGLTAEQEAVVPMVWHCLKIRNQYAHCNWGDHVASDGLWFVDLEETARDRQFFMYWKFLDLELLNQQVEYFNSTMEKLTFITGEIHVKTGNQTQNPFPKPTIPTPPPLHSPPHEHVPPWLDGEVKAHHIARARAAQGGAPTPTLGQQALDKAREEKRVRMAEQRQPQ
ncbi:hypothetical protein [Bradyrhizobium sp. STM 3562]|uniref:hypothetical protein n=1 Tax=Bradyrhizobium sp. STM 3562 TaxID=578924 RepID=UPI0038907E62